MENTKPNFTDCKRIAQGGFPSWVDLLSIIGVFFLAAFLSALIGSFFGALDAPTPPEGQSELISESNSSNGLGLLLMYVGQFLVVIGYVVVLKRLRTGRAFSSVGSLSLKVNPAVLLWSVILLISTSVVVEPLLSFFPHEYLDRIGDFMNRGVWTMVAAVVCAPVLEELLFRGMLQRSLVERYGNFAGIVLASFVFAVVHLNPPQVVNAFFVGLILGFVYFRTQSLTAVIFIHAVNNALSYFLWIVSGEKITTLRQLIGSEKTYYIVYGVALVIVVMSLVNVYHAMLAARKSKIAAEVPPLCAPEEPSDRTTDPTRRL